MRNLLSPLLVLLSITLLFSSCENDLLDESNRKIQDITFTIKQDWESFTISTHEQGSKYHYYVENSIDVLTDKLNISYPYPMNLPIKYDGYKIHIKVDIYQGDCIKHSSDKVMEFKKTDYKNWFNVENGNILCIYNSFEEKELTLKINGEKIPFNFYYKNINGENNKFIKYESQKGKLQIFSNRFGGDYLIYEKHY